MTFALLFGAGIYTGAKLTRLQITDTCLDAGGSVDPRGFCTGASPDD